VDSLPEAEALQGIVLLAPPEEPHSAQGGLYHHQLIGLDVYTKTGESLGPISDILQTGSNDVYVISSGVNEILIPATESVVVQIDLSQGVVIVDLPDGLR
jgi:16S rRNA processing protein RimM